MTLSKLLTDIRDRLRQASGDSTLADVEAVSIIEQSLNITKERIYLDSSISINNNDIARINTVVERRLSGEPLQYIFGKAYFYDREFFVNRNVLIPRPDTETLVDAVINSEEKRKAAFIDIGTGSGILAAVLTAHCRDWTAVAIDISFKALQTASRNIIHPTKSGLPRRFAPRNDRHCERSEATCLSRRKAIQNVTNRAMFNRPLNNHIHLICGDMLSAVKPEKRFDFIVSNPPYISSPQMKTLDKSVAAYEPSLALCGGVDGLDYYRVISRRAGMYLKDTGRIYLEIGFDQGESVPGILRDDGWTNIAVIKDLTGRDRVAVARFSPHAWLS